MMRITLLGIICLCLALSLPLVSGEDEQQEEESDDQEEVFSSIEQFHFNEEGKLATYMLLYPEQCAPHVRAALPDEHEMYMFRAVTGDLERAYFGDILESDENGNDCSIVSVQIGLDKKYVTSPMDRFFFEPFSSSLSSAETLDDNEDHELIADIQQYYDIICRTVEIAFISHHPNPLEVMWVNPHTLIRQFEEPLEYGERNTVTMSATLGDEYVVVDTETLEDIVSYTVEFDAFIVIGEMEDPGKPRRVRDWIEGAHHSEWERHGNVKRSFTPLGFHLGRLPDDVWGSIQAFYYNNEDHKAREEFEEAYINWWEAPPYVIVPPMELKQHWQDQILPLVEKWTGVELESTDIYGMRRYEKGARLLSHVDREETHAASLIINVAQHDATDPWPVEVYDHANRLHEVVMEPGDIVYYESAKCLHGRNRPLPSGSYVNLFTHYRPKGDPQWFEKENPEGWPEPLLDVGECRLVGELDQFSQGAVECDNPAIGPHLSPTMFEAHSAEDLQSWWEHVGPPWDPSLDEEEEEYGDWGDDGNDEGGAEENDDWGDDDDWGEEYDEWAEEEDAHGGDL